jgi:hypothetical protein
MKRVIVFTFSILFVFPVTSQHLIGKTKEDVIREIKNHYPDFAIDNTSVNNTYKYIKYVDKINEQTMLVFLSDDNLCTATKLMSSYSNLPMVKQELTQKYKFVGNDKWEYTINGISYLAILKHEEWFFSVFTSKEK